MFVCLCISIPPIPEHIYLHRELDNSQNPKNHRTSSVSAEVMSTSFKLCFMLHSIHVQDSKDSDACKCGFVPEAQNDKLCSIGIGPNV